MAAYRLLPALRIIPGPVKLRVSFGIAAGLTGLAALGLALRALLPLSLFPPVAATLTLLLISVGSYALWCLWPDWNWGIATRLLAELPCPPEQRVRLSFDDGPTPGLTDSVLDLLAQHRVQATFFLLTSKARSCPRLVRRIVDEGHLVGLHGEDHRVALFRSADEQQAALASAQQELAALTGQPITLYRPSHGWKNRALLRALRPLGLKLVFWDYGVWDTDAPPAEVLIRRLRWATPAAPRPKALPPIVLLHDGRGDAVGVPPHGPSLLQALSQWLPLLHQRAGSGQQRL